MTYCSKCIIAIIIDYIHTSMYVYIELVETCMCLSASVVYHLPHKPNLMTATQLSDKQRTEWLPMLVEAEQNRNGIMAYNDNA